MSSEIRCVYAQHMSTHTGQCRPKATKNRCTNRYLLNDGHLKSSQKQEYLLHEPTL